MVDGRRELAIYIIGIILVSIVAVALASCSSPTGYDRHCTRYDSILFNAGTDSARWVPCELVYGKDS